jgi:uncharacterized protein (DUF2384 family)
MTIVLTSMTEVSMTKIAASGVQMPNTPVDIQTFATAPDRERLSPVAINAYRKIAGQWALTNAEAATLLGVSESTWDRIKRGVWDQPLSQDQLTRASAAIGVYKGLRLLFADDMASRWVKLNNSGPIFQRKAPVDAMIEGGIPLMLETRRYVDALRGGL